MKKIIELAEKYFDEIDSADGIEELEYKARESKMKLQEALSEYKRLSETPITEDWLKEHGWEFDYTIEEATADYHWVTCNGYIKQGEGYLLDWCNGILKISNDFENSEFSKHGATLADLYDACELCEITMED